MRIGIGPLLWSTDQVTYTASGDISNATLYSTPFRVEHLSDYALQVELTGATVTGTLKLQASNTDLEIRSSTNIPNSANMKWTDVSGTSTALTSAGDVMWNVQDAGYRWVRVVWTESGTASGAMTGTAHGKGPH